jgi:CysZ protein
LDPAATVVDAPSLISERRAPLSEAASGFRMLFDGLSFLRRERSLWPLAAIPLGVAILALVGAMSIVFGQADAIQGVVAGWLPTVEAGAWYSWLWVAPAKLGLWLLSSLLFLLASGVVVLASLMLATLVSAPALDLLSQRVEVVESGTLVESGDGSLKAVAIDVGRSLASEARRLLLLASVWAALFVLGMLIPGGQVITAPLMVAFTVAFLPLEYTGHVLDRRRISFRDRRTWLSSQRPRMLGFGLAAFLTLMVPGLNFLVLPALVVAGTLLAVRYPPDLPASPS